MFVRILRLSISKIKEMFRPIYFIKEHNVTNHDKIVRAAGDDEETSGAPKVVSHSIIFILFILGLLYPWPGKYSVSLSHSSIFQPGES